MSSRVELPLPPGWGRAHARPTSREGSRWTRPRLTERCRLWNGGGSGADVFASRFSGRDGRCPDAHPSELTAVERTTSRRVMTSQNNPNNDGRAARGPAVGCGRDGSPTARCAVPRSRWIPTSSRSIERPTWRPRASHDMAPKGGWQVGQAVKFCSRVIFARFAPAVDPKRG